MCSWNNITHTHNKEYDTVYVYNGSLTVTNGHQRSLDEIHTDVSTQYSLTFSYIIIFIRTHYIQSHTVCRRQKTLTSLTGEIALQRGSFCQTWKMACCPWTRMRCLQKMPGLFTRLPTYQSLMASASSSSRIAWQLTRRQ